MKEFKKNEKETICLYDTVWYKRAEFIVERIHHNKLGQVMCELTSVFEYRNTGKRKGDVLVLAQNLSKEKPKSRFNKKGE